MYINISLETQRPGFDPEQLHVKSVVDKWHWNKYFSKYFGLLVSTISQISHTHFNPLKTERNLFYIRTQCVPRCKHSPLRL
jgi:hypothetical protein